jgi:uncharacterized membrane protein YkvI
LNTISRNIVQSNVAESAPAEWGQDGHWALNLNGFCSLVFLCNGSLLSFVTKKKKTKKKKKKKKKKLKWILHPLSILD